MQNLFSNREDTNNGETNNNENSSNCIWNVKRA